MEAWLSDEREIGEFESELHIVPTVIAPDRTRFTSRTRD
jgi:hypothetical protein